MKRCKRKIHFLFIMLLYAVHAVVLSLRTKNLKLLREKQIRLVTKYSRLALQALNTHVMVEGNPIFVRQRGNYLIVANHMSYFDILVLASIFPAVYITSVEVRDSFFLGRMAKFAGSIFIERRNKQNLDKEIEQVADILREGFNVVLFAEGTSTNGEQVLRFKNSFMRAAFEADVEFLPVCLQYLEINGKTFGPENRDLVCYYGDMQFFPHFNALLSLDSVTAAVHFLPPIAPAEIGCHKAAGEFAQKLVSKRYGLPFGRVARQITTIR